MTARPLAGLVAAMALADRPARLAVLLAAAVYIGLVLATFAQALAGLPLV